MLLMFRVEDFAARSVGTGEEKGAAATREGRGGAAVAGASSPSASSGGDKRLHRRTPTPSAHHAARCNLMLHDETYRTGLLQNHVVPSVHVCHPPC